jgi:hypothetical protein
MLDRIVRNSVEIIARTESLIDKVRTLIGSGDLDVIEAYKLQCEIERLTDVMFVVDAAARLLRRTFELRPEMARAFRVHATLQ